MRRTTCSSCGHDELDVFLDLGLSPVADAYTEAPDVDVPRHPLQVAVCAKCGLAQLMEVLDADELFGVGYSFRSSASAPLSAYHAEYARDVLARHGDLARRGVVEVGCNDGDLLRHFNAFPALGVDPADGPAEAARGRGLDVETRPFDLAAAHEIRDRRGRAGIVLANHVLAHVADLAGTLAGIGALLDRDGVAVVEVQYLPDLLVNNAFDLVYHEHRAYFSLATLERAATRHGLYVRDALLTGRQGGSLRAELVKDPAPVRTSRAGDVLRSERWLERPDAYGGTQGRMERVRDRLRDLVREDMDMAIYGAPAKLTTLMAFCGFDVGDLSGLDLGWCVDSTPAKQGRFLPGTHIEIYAPNGPDVPRDGYLLAAHNYTADIMAANPGHRWVVPVPAPTVLRS
jgi:hypothetical protein